PLAGYPRGFAGVYAFCGLALNDTTGQGARVAIGFSAAVLGNNSSDMDKTALCTLYLLCFRIAMAWALTK
ncbi:MAG: hypothetical protein N2Z22_09180, partial [Turneriella sp.]|nr:hypothetical protein [Turneriella sp.]